MPRPTLTHLSCSPNFPCASYLDERMLTYELIVNCSVTSIERAYNISLACEPFNPLTPKISLVILLTFSYTVLVMFGIGSLYNPLTDIFLYSQNLTST